VLVPVIHKKGPGPCSITGSRPVRPGPEYQMPMRLLVVGAAHRITLARRPSGSVHRDPLDPRTQPWDAADRAEGPVGVDLELVERAGGASFVVEVLPVS
jgi:hypothetical protein